MSVDIGHRLVRLGRGQQCRDGIRLGSGGIATARPVESSKKAGIIPTVKSLDSFDFAAFPSLNKALGALAVCRVRHRCSNRPLG